MQSGIIQRIFDLQGKTIVITGGGGVLCSGLARELAGMGANIAVLDVNRTAAACVAEAIRAEGGTAMEIECDVLDRGSIDAAAETVIATFGSVDVLINGAGGNKSQATTGASQSFFDLPADALEWVFKLNFNGMLFASQAFGKEMAKQGEGVILNFSSMNSFRPLTRIPAYSAAKAAVNNFTQWLAVHMAQEYSPRIRVNAIAPGFFQTEQNRYLLSDPDTGELTERGQKIIQHTPMARFGVSEDLVGTVIWLISPASGFVSGAIVPIDGGFAAYSGV